MLPDQQRIKRWTSARHGGPTGVAVADAMDSDTRMRQANRRLIEAHEAERERVAKELHDDIGQRLAVMRMDLDILAQALPLEASEVRLRVGDLSERTLALAKDVQALSHRLNPPMLGFLGVVSASAGFCRELAERQHVDVAFSHEGIPDGLPAYVARSLFRVLQEAVTNAVKHAGVSRVAVALCGSPEAIGLEISDAGVGFDPDSALSGRGAGLVGMRERVRSLGGELFIESRPGAGTSIRARVPIGDSGQPLVSTDAPA
jgi:signal transduction histidine kinase